MRSSPRGGAKRKTRRSDLRVTTAKQSAVQPIGWTAILLLSIIVGTPLMILPARFETYSTTPKLAVLYLSSALLLWRAGEWWPGCVVLWRTRVGTAFYSLLAAAIISLLVSSALSADPWLSFGGTTWRRLGAITQIDILLIGAIVAGYIWGEIGAARKLMLGMEAAGAIASVYAILQYAGWDPLIPAATYMVGAPPVLRPPATLTQATYFATFLLPAILAGISFRVQETTSRWKRVHELAIFLSTAALFLSGTRSALLGLLLGATTLIWCERSRITNRRSLLHAAYLLLGLGALTTAFLFLPARKNVRGRLNQWMAGHAAGPRLLVWRDSLPILWRHAPVGIGPELFEEKFRSAESLELARTYPDHYHESPHNFFLEAALNQGLIGLACWAALLGVASWRGILSCRLRIRDGSALAAAALAMLVSLQFCPLTLTNELYLLVLCAMLIALGTPAAEVKASRTVPSPMLSACRTLSLAMIVIAAAYITQAALYWSVESNAADGDLDAAARWYESARKFPMPGPNLALSQRLARLAQRLPASIRADAFTLAVQASETGELRGDGRFDSLYQSAMLAIIARDLPRAEMKLRAAINASPAWYRPRMALASVLWWQRRNQEAEHEAALALDCAGSVGPSVKRTLAEARAQASLVAARRPAGIR
jgi:hypothetical protein